MDEHEFEPVRGLPENLPAGESIMWQGSPQWQSLAIHAFHARKLAVYFALLLVWRAASLAFDGATSWEVVTGVAFLVPFAVAAVGLACLMAWMTARAAVYTITNRRVALRIGVVLEVTFNLPFGKIDSAALRAYRDGTGDIALTLSGDDRIAYAHLWPHARPWQLAKPQPMLRCVADARRVVTLLGRSLALDLGAANDAEGARVPQLAATR
jgi:hypothetical protein